MPVRNDDTHVLFASSQTQDLCVILTIMLTLNIFYNILSEMKAKLITLQLVKYL